MVVYRTMSAVLGQDPTLTAKVTANPLDNRGPQRTTLDRYTHPDLHRSVGQEPSDHLTSPRVKALYC